MNCVHPIAIVGLACRFPGAANADRFWDNLKNGVESVSFFKPEELREAGVETELIEDPNYVRARSLLDEVDCFDAEFFGFSPREAAAMDPQHRVFLETAWQALENAGCAGQETRRATGVFAGCYLGTYLLANLCANREYINRLLSFKEVGAFQTFLGNDKDYLTSRVAYKLNLRGPAVTVQTACSTSLVAVCQACQSLRQGECDLALAGGVTITFPQKKGYLYQEGGMLSPDGHCRAFDAGAQGTVFGSGIGLVVLKRLEDALEDRDTIRAVIKGSALNNDGSDKVSYTAPSPDGQAEVIALAQALGGVSADTISYIEAHGTGTPLGDPIEIAGLTQAFRRTSQRRNFCAIGSVKTNIGHLDVAAGVAGLIKCVLALERRQIPPSLHFTSPNPKIDFVDSPFYVNDRLAEWTANGHPRRAGVSSFGVGGTNAHVVLEEAPPAEVSGPSRRWQLLTLSAKCDDALARAAENLCAHLRASPDVDLADVAFSLQTGRRDFPCRRFVIAGDTAAAITALETPDSGCAQSRRQPRGDVPVVFMFPGQGAQHVNMGAELYQTEPIFRLEFDRCADWLRSHFQLDLRAALYPAPDDTAAAEKRLIRTSMTQPALFAVEYAMAKLWVSWGVKPAAMIGHSLGEYVAGCLADVFSLEDALRVVASRAQWVQEQPAGAMLAVRLTEAELQPFLQANASVSIAAINAPAACVVSGPFPAIEEMERQLTERRVGHRRLHTSHAFHSAMMDPVAPRLVQLLRRTRLNPPRIPYVSNVTGNWVQDSEATDPEYWAGHVRQPVRFADGVARFFHDNQEILLEVGPGQTLATLARQHPGRPSEQTILSSLTGRKEGEAYSLVRTLGGLWLGGARPGWKEYWINEQRRRVFLPPYPFERKRYWVEPPVPQTSSQADQQSVCAEQAPAFEPQRSTTTEIVMSAEPLQNTGRDQEILNGLRTMFQELSGTDLSNADPAATFLELGFDSLFLTQARQLLQSRFNVKITYRQLMEDVPSLGALAAYIDQQLPPDAAPTRPQAAVGAAPAPSTTGPAPAVTDANSAPDPRRGMAGAAPMQAAGDTIRDAGSLAGLFHKQLETVQHLIEQQLSLLGQRNGGDAKAASAFVATAPPTPSAPVKDPGGRNGAAPSSSSATGAKAERTGFGPYQPPRKEAGSILTPAQSKWLEDFISRYTERTARSKANAQAQRKAVADPRSIANFRLLWKELVYQIVVDRAEGARLWDIDGNEYIDVTMGFGVNLFGHSPPFVCQAAAEQLGKGIAIGPQSLLTGEVADLVRGFTGMERVTFCNTGSEAVLAAMRVARTVTGRSKIAYFNGDYHGMFDEVLCRPHASGGRLRSVPVAPGIPPSAGDDALIFEYGAPETLDRLREHAGELAAVLVEPVQSRHPDLQPKEFLHELRRLTEQSGALLIFDEVITGFRVHPGGAQAIFGVRPDLAAYGKVAGGGFPIGILAGRAGCMDVLDGGDWRYGDNSSPEADMTFFAGTFVRHPLALAAAKASLLHLKERGPALQQELNDKTASMARTLNAYFEEHNAPIQVHHFGSLFRFHFHPAWPFAPLFVFHALEKGIYFREAHQNCFLSTAHTNDDVDRIISAFKASSRLLEEAGLAGTATHAGRPPRDTGQGPGGTGKAGEMEEPVTTGLTEGQREIWQACQLSPEASCAYNESFTLRCRGRIDVARMHDAIQAVVARHEALRIRIDPAGENLSVAAPAAVKLELPFEDLSARPRDDQAKRLAEIHAEESREPFDLEKGPLIRVRLIKIADDEHALIFTANHLVCDGESSATILADLGAFYSAACRGVTHTPAAAPSFLKFAQEQAKRVGDAEDAADEKWWREQFATPVPNLALPADHPRPASRAAQAGMARAVLSQESTQALRRAGKTIGCTLFGTLFTAFKALLHRLSGQEEFAVGTFASVPSMSGWQGLVGHGISLLPIRSRLDPDKDPSFRDFARSLQSRCLDAQEHGAYTYGRLVRQLRLPRQPGCAPLLQAVFNLDRKENEKLKFEELTVEVSPNAHASVVFDLFLNVRETADRMYFDLEYNATMFEPSTVERWLRHYQTLLEAVITNPQTPVGTLPLLAPSEKKAVLAASQGPALTVPSVCLHELFEAQAQRTPRAVAVTWNREDLTYRELDRCAQELADRLRSLGVGPESLVGICLERQPSMIVSMLAVLKVGGAYVPLDPRYPAERLAYIREDSKARVILTTAALQEKLGFSARDLAVVEVDRPRPAGRKPARGTGNADAPRVRPDNLAYVIYTSGSTGHPKGVGIEHRNAVAFVEWVKTVFSADQLAGVLASTSICFDLSVFEIFGTLCHGGQVILAENALECASLPGRDQIRLINSVPSIMTELLRSGTLPPSVRTVTLAGEPLSRELVREIYARPGIEKVYDLYGPSETTTYSTVALRQAEAPPTIGRPIAGTQIYVVDSRLEPVPPGICGELVIGGAGVGRGYLRQDELTAAKFIADPWSPHGDGRLYRTGDQGRYQPDGNLELLGRLDDQVKVRGFRIELGEVESVLSEHPLVENCAVVAHSEPGSVDRQLVSFVVPARAQAEKKTAGEDAWLNQIVAQFESGYGAAIRENAQDQTQDPTLNIYAWSGLQRTEHEVSDWIEGIASRLLASKPKRLLEIGCGTGLLLFRLAPHVAEYWATDLSPSALDDIRRRLGPAGLDPSKIKLIEQMAHEFSGLPASQFDGVILNGVIEYFPNVDYLLRVLKGAVGLLAPGGFVFLGAIPNLAAQEILHVGGELSRAADSEDGATLRRRARNRMAADRRLLVTPEFFRELPNQIPEVTAVKVQALRGAFENEASQLLTDASFDVFLKTGAPPRETRTVHRLNWKTDSLDPDAVIDRVRAGGPSDVWWITDVPHDRMWAHGQLLAAWPGPGTTAAELRKRLATGMGGAALNNLLAACSERSVMADVRWSNDGADGLCDVVIYPRDTTEPAVGQEPRPGRRLGVHASDPQRAELVRGLVPELRRFLQQKLPDHLVPTKFVLLDTMPLTPNGKRDRKALENLDIPMDVADEPGVEPRTPAETALAQIWCDVLRRERVGVHDNFFDLGGHSLLVAQVVGRIRDAFEVDLPMRKMFENPTVARLAAAVEERLVETIQTLSDAEAERLATAPGEKKT